MKTTVRTTSQKALTINDFQNTKIKKSKQKKVKGGDDGIGIEDIINV